MEGSHIERDNMIKWQQRLLCNQKACSPYLYEIFILWKATLLTYLFQSFQTKLCYQVFISAHQRHYWKLTLFSLCKTSSVLSPHPVVHLEIFLALHFSFIPKIHFLLFVVMTGSLLCCFFSISALTSTHFIFFILIWWFQWLVLESINQNLFCFLPSYFFFYLFEISWISLL